MAKSPSPLTFEVDAELLASIEEITTCAGHRSKSKAIREALVNFDLSGFDPPRSLHSQLSVRIGSDLKPQLLHAAKEKKVSLGQILRAAIVAQSERLSPARQAAATAAVPVVKVDPKPVESPHEEVAVKVSRTEYNGKCGSSLFIVGLGLEAEDQGPRRSSSKWRGDWRSFDSRVRGGERLG